MSGFIVNWLRRRRLRKDASDIPTGFLPLGKIKSANVVIDAQEPDFELLREDILSWGKACGIKVSIFFIDMHKPGKGELPSTSIQRTICRKELSWYGAPPADKVQLLMNDDADLFICMVDSSDFLVDYLCKCSHARFEVGRKEYPGHSFDMIIANNAASDHRSELRSDSREVFACIQSFLKKIQ